MKKSYDSKFKSRVVLEGATQGIGGRRDRWEISGSSESGSAAGKETETLC